MFPASLNYLAKSRISCQHQKLAKHQRPAEVALKSCRCLAYVVAGARLECRGSCGQCCEKREMLSLPLRSCKLDSLSIAFKHIHCTIISKAVLKFHLRPFPGPAHSKFVALLPSKNLPRETPQISFSTVHSESPTELHQLASVRQINVKSLLL